ncbi:unnamed protein product [Closterium sp. NIES-54]
MGDSKPSGGGGGGGGSGLQLDLDTFGRRLKLLYDSWRKDESRSWGNTSAFAVATPPASEDMRYLKSSALQIWLLGYEFPETVMVFLLGGGAGGEGGGSGGAVHVVCSQKKAQHLEAVRRVCAEKSGGVEMVLHPKPRSEDGSSQMAQVIDAIRASGAGSAGGGPVRLGVLAKEAPEGAIMEKWAAAVEAAAGGGEGGESGGEGLETVDVGPALGDVLAVKDEGEVINIKKAAFLSAQALKAFVVPKMEVLIDEERSMTHAELMEQTEEVITDPAKIKVKLKPDNCDICYPPVFQSGGQYDLRASAVSSDDPLCYDSMGVIICAIGARYASYCSNVARTYLIDATKAQEKAYQVLLRAQEAAIAAIKPGVRLGDVYRAAVAVVEREAPELVPHLTKHAGTGIGIDERCVPTAVAVVEKEAPELVPHLTKHAGTGIGIAGLTNPGFECGIVSLLSSPSFPLLSPEFREAGLTLNAKNERTVKSGMAFNVVLGLHGLTNPEAGGGEEGAEANGNAEGAGGKEGGKDGGKEGKGGSAKLRKYALLVADTVAVRGAADKDRWVDVATASASKSFADVAYSLKGEDEEEEDTDKGKRPAEAAGAGEPTVFARAHLRSENREATKEELRRQNQAELAKQKIEETARRLAAGGLGAREGEGAKRQTGDLVSYGDVDEIPLAMKDYKIQVDQRHESVLLPIYGLLVPFHVCMIRNVTSQQDGGHIYIRIIFNVPGAGFSAADLPMQKFPDSIFIKELSFKSTDSRHANQVVQLIKTMSKHVRQRESERAERATLVTQEKLQLSKGRPPRLPDLWIRPSFGGKGRKLTGSLEAHLNGFRYSTAKPDERVEVMYGNIKHAFFQPAENEMITLLHFHLHNPIMVGKKKTKDVQFFAEVMEVVQTVGGSRRSAYDPDEIEEEQRERERRSKINREFKSFVSAVHSLWEKDRELARLDLEFDVPFRELGFHGVPHKSSAFIVPTVNCLVELIEVPFLVVTLNEVEIVNLERVGLGQKTFDMAIVFKDFKRDFLRIDAIPSTSLDSVKEWLNSMNIKYYESRLNLSWKAILQNIMSDPEAFLADGGWEFLNLEASDSEGEESEESQAYEPSDLEEAASDDDDDESEDDESVVDSEEEEGEEEEEEEEEGPTWDELEAKALREDREKGEESDTFTTLDSFCRPRAISCHPIVTSCHPLATLLSPRVHFLLSLFVSFHNFLASCHPHRLTPMYPPRPLITTLHQPKILFKPLFEPSDHLVYFPDSPIVAATAASTGDRHQFSLQPLHQNRGSSCYRHLQQPLKQPHRHPQQPQRQPLQQPI